MPKALASCLRRLLLLSACLAPTFVGSGVAFDLRKKEHYLPYDRTSTSTFPSGPPATPGIGGGSGSRRSARRRGLFNKLSTAFPLGPLQAKVPKVIKVPKGETYVRAENPKGEMGYYLVSDGGSGPYRLKIRSASYSNISILPVGAGRCAGTRHPRHHGKPRLRARGRGIDDSCRLPLRGEVIEWISRATSSPIPWVSLAGKVLLVAIIVPVSALVLGLRRVEAVRQDAVPGRSVLRRWADGAGRS